MYFKRFFRPRPAVGNLLAFGLGVGTGFDLRMLPVTLSLLGAGLRRETVLFLGWFGPRGIASILFGLLVVEGSVLPHREEIFLVVLITVAMSIVAHGVTAFPGADWYSRHAESYRDDTEAGEHKSVSEMPVRIRIHSPSSAASR